MPSSAKGSFVSSASEVNQTFEHQTAAIGKPNKEVSSEEDFDLPQANLKTPQATNDEQGEQEEVADDDVEKEMEGIPNGGNQNKDNPASAVRGNSTEGERNPANVEGVRNQLQDLSVGENVARVTNKRVSST